MSVVRSRIESSAVAMEELALTPNANMSNDPMFAMAKKLFETQLELGRSTDEAAFELEKFGIERAVILDIQLRVEQEGNRIKAHGDAAVFDPSGESWYFPQGGDHKFFAQVRERLEKDLGKAVANDVSDAADQILGSCGNPHRSSFDNRGLVVGYVQSGKTTSFMSLAAKAVDYGYKFVIILSGMTDNLRSQTQDRVDDVLVGKHKAEWHALTSKEHDFVGHVGAEAILNPNNGQGVLAVVKKNPGRLRRLVKWLNQAQAQTVTTPILVIDDEADQATPNTAKARDRASRINGLLRQLVSFPKVSYVAYTATPFANLLMDTEAKDDLFPRDFIVSLPEPDGYMGTTQLFGRTSLSSESEEFAPKRVISYVSDEESSEVLKNLKSLDGPKITQGSGFSAAILWFLIATAARRIRDQKSKHSSMLVNVSPLADVHFNLQSAIDSYLLELKSLAEDDLKPMLRTVWDQQEAEATARAESLEPVDFESAAAGAVEVLGQVKTVVDNYKSDNRLYYGQESAETVIVIGGNTMSRGLTLEGLISSYFLRSSRTYDTLLQMGRWFGFRPGYTDLPRVWMTTEMSSWFADLALIEAEIREQIRAYAPAVVDGKVIPGHHKPTEVAVKIRQHPSMAVVAPNKARFAKRVSVSLSEKKLQTTVFESKDAEVLLDNQNSVRQLFEDASANSVPLHRFGSGRLGLAGVSAGEVVSFLRQYHLHPGTRTFDIDLIADYLKKENQANGLNEWNIVVEGSHLDAGAHPERASLELGLPNPVVTVNRSRRVSEFGAANIGALITENHRNLDTLTSEDAASLTKYVASRGKSASVDRAILDWKRENNHDRGLLVIYPIDKDSTYALAKVEGKDERFALDADEHVIGIALFFPPARGPESMVEFVAAAASDALIDPDEEIAEAEAISADEEDEHNAVREQEQDANDQAD